MRFVLDNSVAMRWLIPSLEPSDQQYAERVLKSMNEADALVPELWHLEMSNVLLGAEKSGEITVAQTEAFTSQLENLPISVDSSTWRRSFGRTMVLARSYGLSSYDAAYLELAVRESLMLASLDRTLLKAAEKAGIGIYLEKEQENA